ncbi:type II toxin-antitoxin system RelE/ParE family toxin [Roseateles sp.]|uniref:type II toxin-antitoxin system RelE/ParE family toxin n=1 Tax=Roseateles sp. TaxID=1971397 RepID=UPI002E09ED2C|nr:type II toxin-antitoxin system RelE/ParE family toxin [Roseateles sp.]
MTGFILSPLAQNDLGGIWDYTARHWGNDQADHYVRQIVAVCADLAAGRKPGRNAEAIRPGYRKCAVGSHVLFYRIGEGVEVIRILHQRMDVERHL